MRMNVRLIRASQFLRQFQLDVRHKPGKDHIIPDALSRLASTNHSPDLAPEHSELDCLFTASFVKISDEFHAQILQGYEDDSAWRRIVKIIDNPDDDTTRKLPFVRGKDLPAMDSDPYFAPRPENGESSDQSENLGTDVYDDLVYHVDKYTGHYRLCVPDVAVDKILQVTHGNGHPGYERCYEAIAKTWYIRHLGRYLKDYLRHCPDCLVFQTRRHRPYGVLEPIQTPSVPFQTITLDFILALPVSENDEFDCIMSVTCKFSKRVTFIPGKSTWTAAQWAIALLDRLAIGDWGIPGVIITDRDRKFLSELWSTIFEKLGVNLLYSTAYHPQTDGSSERTNQTAEIALRFYLNTLPNLKEWPKALPRMQAMLNNSTTITGKSPNDVIYGFSLNKALDLAVLPKQLPQHDEARINAADAISYAQMSQKFHYDRKHQPMFLRPGIDKAYLRLHKGYNIPSTASVKRVLGQQYVGPFDIIRKVGFQAYELAIPNHWKIHPVITVAMLEPAPQGPDPYERPLPDRPDSVYVEGDNDEYKSWEIQRLLNRRVTRRGRGYSVQYLVRWKGYGPEYDTWYRVKDLDNAKDLVEEYDRIAGIVRG